MSVRLITGDCRDALRTLDAESVDAIVTDPPYGLGFMGREWDAFSPAIVRRREVQRDRKGTERASERWPTKLGTTQGGGVAVQYDESASGNQRFQAWCESWAVECLRVLKPGGHLLACGGPRTFHRLTSGIEDAGFEVRDVLCWIFGSGFPKSKNLPGGLGTALKPAYEPIVLARKPLIGTVAANVERSGTGALNIDGCRIASDESTARTCNGVGDSSSFNMAASGEPRINGGSPLGRWPANVALDEDAARLLDAEVGILTSGHLRPVTTPKQNDVFGAFAVANVNEFLPNAGGPSRYFYTAKSSRTERNRGLEGMPERVAHDDVRMNSGGESPQQTPNQHRAQGNHHPTVKPIALMRWLVRLIVPPAGIVLDPFMGSGSTGVAAVYEEFSFVGIEKEAEYLEIARRRIERAQGPMFAAVEVS